jgi:hypothetical protein
MANAERDFKKIEEWLNGVVYPQNHFYELR